jgi:hypothetical protein
MVMIGDVGDGVGLLIAQGRGEHELLRRAIRALPASRTTFDSRPANPRGSTSRPSRVSSNECRDRWTPQVEKRRRCRS